MDYWPKVALGSVVDFLDHLRKPVTASDRVAGPYPYYGANGQQGTIDGYIFDEPLLLLAEDGGHFDNPARGIAYRISGRSWVNNHAHVLRMTPALDLDYAAAVLANMDVRKYITGTTRMKLTKAGAARIEIPLPPVAEQRRIAGILDQADSLRIKRRKVLTLLHGLAQAIFVDMFVGDVELQPISDLCELLVDCVNRTAPTVEGPTPYKMIRTSNVRGGRIDTSNVKFVTADVFERWNRRATPQRGDVILTREAPVGEVGVLESEDRVFLGQRLYLYRPDPRKLTPEFLLACFRSPVLAAQFERLGSGSTVKHLPLPACQGFMIPAPPLEQQLEYSTRVRAVSRIIALSKHAETSDEMLFRSLQRDAFRPTGTTGTSR